MARAPPAFLSPLPSDPSCLLDWSRRLTGDAEGPKREGLNANLGAIGRASAGRRSRSGKLRGPMPRSIWTGAISFGLVTVPVKLYSAVSRKTVRFHQLDSADGVRISQKRVNPVTGDEVPYDRLVKGYEISPYLYVLIDPCELDALEPTKTRTIDIEALVERFQIAH